MSDEKISQMPDIITATGSLQSTDRVPLIRPGVIANYSVAVGSLEASGGAGPPVYFHAINTSAGTQFLTLPTAAADNEQHVYKDISGGHPPGTGAISISAGGLQIDNNTVFPAPPEYCGNWAQYTFRWRISLNKWLVG